jgi:hypothetical protein
MQYKTKLLVSIIYLFNINKLSIIIFDGDLKQHKKAH